MPLSLWWKGVLSSPPAIDSPEQILLIREENREVTESLRSPVDDYPLDGVGLSVEGSLAGVVPLLKHTVTQKKRTESRAPQKRLSWSTCGTRYALWHP